MGNKKYTLTKKGWIALGIISVVLISIITYSILNKNEKTIFEKVETRQTTSEKLYASLKNKEITIDEYVLYSAYSLYDNEKLDDKYKSEVKNELPPNLYNLVKNYEDQISAETKDYINKKIQMSDLNIGPEIKKETTKSDSNIIPMSNNIANNVENRLDKHILSPNGKVVVWYTTNDTKDKITDEQAKIIANSVEEIINEYSNKYGVEFKFEKSYLNYFTDETYKSFLNKIDSNNAQALFKAMPIYVSSSYISSNTAAYYVPLDPGHYYSKFSGNGNTNELSGIPVGPYINVVSNKIEDYDSLKFTIAHELFHHFQAYICGEGKYSPCQKNNNGDPNFIIETTANWAAAKIAKKSDSINQYVIGYLNDVDKTIDDVNPYCSMNFLMTYENVIDNGDQKIINGLLKKYHNKDTLKYLYEASDDKIDEVMNVLSKNNLINNYEFDNFKAVGSFNASYITMNDLKNYSNDINPVAMNYLISENNNKKYKIYNLSKIEKSYINIFSVSDIEEINDIRDYKNIKVIYSKKFEKDIIIDLSKIDSKYVIVSITNGDLYKKLQYKTEKTNEEMNITLNIDNKNNEKQRPDQVYKIYIDGKEHKINNFELNGRAFVDINKFCTTTNICTVSYTDDSYNKIKVTSILKSNNTNYKYVLINEKEKQVFDSTLVAGNVNFDLSQLSVDTSSCPNGKDSNGYEIPKCDKNSFYVPIRFVTQALGYDVEWNEKNSERIDINSGLQEKLMKDNNIRTILSKDKVKMGDVVTNIIELGSEIYLKKNEKYYAYSINKDNKRVYNSGISLLSGDKNNFKIKNDLDTNKNIKTTYSSLEIGNKKNSSTISIVTTITIPSNSNKHKAGIYPIIKEVKVNIKE